MTNAAAALFLIVSLATSCENDLLSRPPGSSAVNLTKAPLVVPSLTSATIAWNTNVPTTGQVDFGIVSGTYTGSTVMTTVSATANSASLLNLAPNQHYYFRVKSYLADHQTNSAEYVFATSNPTATLTAPVTLTLGQSATALAWSTDVATTSQVEYGTSTGVYSWASIMDAVSGATHTATLTGLTPSTTYYYRINSFNSGVQTNGLEASFTTLANAATSLTLVMAPTSTSMTSSLTSLSSATISWSTNQNSLSLVQFGTSSGVYTSTTVLDTIASSAHVTVLSGLAPGTTYFYRLQNFSTVYTNLTTAEFSVSTAVAVEPTEAHKNRSIWIVGGLSGSGIGTTVGSVDLYDPVLNVWYPAVTTLPTPVSFAAYAATAGKLYIFGGFDSSGIVQSKVQVYDIASDSWSAGAVLPSPRANIGATVLNGKIEILGGTTGAASAAWVGSTSIFEYSTAGNSWVTKTTVLPAATSERLLFASSSTVYQIGGRSSAVLVAAPGFDGFLPDVPSSAAGSLTTVVESPWGTPRTGASGDAYAPGSTTGSVVFVGGATTLTGTTGNFIGQGTTAATLTNLVQYLYEPYSGFTAAVWLLPVGGQTTYPLSLAFAATVVSTEFSPARIYTFGGTSSLSSPSSTVSSYYTDVPTAGASWTIPGWVSTTLPTGRWGHGAVTLNQ